MKPYSTRLRERRAVLRLAPAALIAGLMPAAAQFPGPPGTLPDGQAPVPEEGRLPNGKSQREEIAKADYQQNLKDARDLIELAKSFELDLEKDEHYVLSLSSLKKLDEMEKLTRRIRSRLKKI